MQNNNKTGGKILASGGFGCVFSPALKCKNSKKREKNKVSKLMTLKNAKEEYDTLIDVKEKLNKIPNYKDYFLVDNYSICIPDNLTKTDLSNFNKCSALKKKNITKKNINKTLDKLLVLNMPYGGITLEQFFTNNKNYNRLKEVNNHMIQLLKYGIIEMNEQNIYHSDIKGSNILIDDVEKNSMTVRLIDWSLATEYIPFKNNKFPHNWKNRPLQFNVPFSVLLFTDLFVEKYTTFLEKNHRETSRSSLSQFIKQYLTEWFKERGLGHLKYINKIMYTIFYYDLDVGNIDISKRATTETTNNYTVSSSANANATTTSPNKNEQMKKYVEKTYTFPYIINYLVEILVHFTKFKSDGSLNLRFYLDNVFIKIVDIWGFIISYFPFYELFFENYHDLTKEQHVIFKKIRTIFLKYLYEPRIKPIEIKDLEHELKEINDFIKI